MQRHKKEPQLSALGAILLLAVATVAAVAGCSRGGEAVGRLSAPEYNNAYHNAVKGMYMPPGTQPDPDYDKSQITQVAVCSSGSGLYVAYMPAADGLTVARLVTQGDEPRVTRSQMVENHITVRPGNPPRMLSEAPPFDLTGNDAGGFRLLYLDPWQPRLMEWAGDMKPGGVREAEFALPADISRSHALFDEAQGRVSIYSNSEANPSVGALYVVDAARQYPVAKAIQPPWGSGDPFDFLDPHMLAAAGHGVPRLFGVIANPDAGAVMYERTAVGLVKISSRGLEPVQFMGFYYVPWAVARGKGSVHVLYPATDHNASAGSTVLADSYESNGVWHTVRVDALGKTQVGVGKPQNAFLCFPTPVIGSDGDLHIVYYAYSRSSIAQAVWKDGQWRTWDCAPARHVIALDAVEFDGKLAVVWAEGETDRVYARLVSLSAPGQSVTAKEPASQ